MSAPSSRRGLLTAHLLVLAGLAYLAASAEALPVRSGRAAFPAHLPTDTLIVLPVPWIQVDSVTVNTTERRLIPYDDYRIIEPGNRLWLFRPLRPGDTLFVDFQYEPIPLSRTYLRRTLRDLKNRAAGDSSSPLRVVVASSEENLAPAWSKLNKSGSLIRSVQIGTDQDLQLESALNFTVVGRVGKNVDVTAALSDQSTPIQPEGTTESINELDKVFVSVTSPHFGAILGDHSAQYPGGEFDSYSRKLTGVLGSYHDSTIAASAGGASSRGEFFSNEFAGNDANQGPYLLRDREGASGILVLAGTETVWLDGRQLRRGESNDYVMDYGAGALTFTVRNLINAASRIVVDFQYANEDYERLFLNSRVRADLSRRRISGSATYISESDNRNQPLGISLSESDRATLERAGDRADSAVVQTADSIGTGGGDYVAVDTVVAEVVYRIFLFSPRDSLNRSTGEWAVTFDDFGEGDGDYQASADELGIVYFYWVGVGYGRYRPVRRLPLAERFDLSDVRLESSLVPGVTVGAEGAISRRDRNAFSPHGDQDNDGKAGVLTLGFERKNPRLAGAKFHRIALRAKARARDSKFSEVNRSPETEFARDWDLARNSGSAENSVETSATFSPHARLNFDGSFGELERARVSRSVRRTAGISVNFPNAWTTRAGLTAISSADSSLERHGEWRRYQAGSEGTVGRFAPRVKFDREQKDDRARSAVRGFRFDEWRAGSGVRLSPEFFFDAGLLRRAEQNQVARERFAKSAAATEVESALTWNRAATGSAEFRLVHRERTFESADSADIKADAGKLDLLLSPAPGWLDGNLSYQVANSRSANEVLVAVQVTPGTGNYRKEGEQFIPDDQGDYVLVPRSTGTFQPASDLALNTEFAFHFDELKAEGAPRWVRLFATESEVTIEERTRLPLDMRLFVLDPARLRGDSTLAGSVQFRQDFHLFRLSRKLALRTRYRNQRGLQNQYLNGGQTRRLDEVSVRARAQYASILRGETELESAREAVGYSSGVIPDREIRRFRLEEDAILALSRMWEIGFAVRGEEVQDERSGTQASLREARPHATLTVAGRGRFEGEFAWNHATANKALIPFELGRGANRGENLRWTARGTYNFGPYISGSLSYTARRDAGESVFQTGRIEARASL